MLYDKGYTIKGVQKEFGNDIKVTKNLLQELTDLRDYLTSKINNEESNKQT